MNMQILSMAAVTAVFFGGVVLWLREQAHKLDRERDRLHPHSPGE